MTRPGARSRRGAALLGLALTGLLAASCSEGPGEAPGPPGPAPEPPVPTSADAPLDEADGALLARAARLVSDGLPETVGSVLAPLLARSPVPADAQFIAGSAAYDLGRYGEAVERLGAAVEAKPAFLPSASALGFAHHKRGDFERAEEVFTRIVEVQPGAHKAHYGLALVTFHGGRGAEAGEHLQRCLTLEPGYLKGRFLRAQLLEAGGDSQGALDELDAVLEAWPSHEEALYLKARLLAAAGREAEAEVVLARRAAVYAAKERIGDLGRRVREGEDHPDLRRGMVEAFLEMGDRREASRVLRAALVRFPRDGGLLALAERLSRGD